MVALDGGVAVTTLMLGSIVDYPVLEPTEIKAPTLWLIGAADTSAMENVKAYEPKLKGTAVTLKLLDGLSYSDTFSRIDAGAGRGGAVPQGRRHDPPSRQLPSLEESALRGSRSGRRGSRARPRFAPGRV